MKICIGCGEIRPQELFEGTRNTCKICRNAYKKNYYAKNKEVLLEEAKSYRSKNKKWVNEKQMIAYYKDPKKFNNKRISHMLKRTYGITLDEYNQMLVKQNDQCALCKTHKTEKKKRFAVDHNHNTGKIRALLCDSCNRGLGLFKDKISLLHQAIVYLKKHGAYGEKTSKVF